jgi:hypothetical protein
LTAYLDLADYLLIAEEVLGAPAETIAGWPGIGLAESALNAPRGLESASADGVGLALSLRATPVKPRRAT